MTKKLVYFDCGFFFSSVIQIKTAGATERKTAGTRDGMVRASARVRDQHTPSAQ